MAKHAPRDKNRKPSIALPEKIREIGDDVISSMKKDGFGTLGETQPDKPAGDAPDSTPQFITLTAGHSNSEEKTPLWHKWRSEFADKQVRVSSRDEYLELVEAEADCMIWLIAIDVHLESAVASAPQDSEFERLNKNAERAFTHLRKAISRTKIQGPAPTEEK